MKYTQFLIFEIGTKCNLRHEECPLYAPDRYENIDTSRELNDEKIVEIAERMYNEFGFTGLIGWHYYNEPLVYRNRIQNLMAAIKSRVPQARFILWTNGQLIGSHQDLQGFDMVRITDYEGKSYGWVAEAVPDMKVMRWNLDGRLDKKGGGNARCRRMFTEFVIDFYGNVHVCCIDWKRDVDAGNVITDDLRSIIHGFQKMRMSMCYKMTAGAPEKCRSCGLRTKDVALLEREICRDTNEALKGGRVEVIDLDIEDEEIGPEEVDIPEDSHEESKIAVVCYSPSGEVPDDSWVKSVESYGKYLGIADNNKMMNEMFRSARRDGFTEGLTLWPDEEVTAAGGLKRASKIARLIPIGCEGEFLLTIMLTDFMYYFRAIPTYKGGESGYSILSNCKVIRRFTKPVDYDTAVVLVSHKVPEQRLRDHFKWNHDFYKSSGVSVFVVTDKEYGGLPKYAKCLVYPNEMGVFNLSATSNFGIRYAIDSGFERIIKTDVDISYMDATWKELMTTEEGRGVVPLYRMTMSFNNRATDFTPDMGATGTISMIASDWIKAHFNENCVGYGVDDRILLMAMRRSGIYVDDCIGRHVYHIAHIEGTKQDNSGPRKDYWNRDSGYNPENNDANRKFCEDPIYDIPTWGLADWSDIVIVAAVEGQLQMEEIYQEVGPLLEEAGVRMIVFSPLRMRHFDARVRFILKGQYEQGGDDGELCRRMLDENGIESTMVWIEKGDSIEDVRAKLESVREVVK